MVDDQNALKEHYEQYKIFKEIKKEKPKKRVTYRKKAGFESITNEGLRTRA